MTQGLQVVNVTAFPDAGSAQPVTSVPLFDTEDEARKHSMGQNSAAYWPPRV